MASLKKSHVKRKRSRNPDFANLRILIKRAEKLQAALDCKGREQFKALGLKYPKPFKRLILSEGLYGFDSKVEAYRHAYVWRDTLLQSMRKVKVHSDSDQKTCSVYCMKLKNSVWQNQKFASHNPDLVSQTPNAFYVGQTSAPILQRLKQHINPDSDKSSKWGLDFFDYDTEHSGGLEAAMEQSLTCVHKWQLETGRSVSSLTLGESLMAEADLAAWLQSQGLGAYFA